MQGSRTVINYGVGESNGDFGFTSYEVESYDG